VLTFMLKIGAQIMSKTTQPQFHAVWNLGEAGRGSEQHAPRIRLVFEAIALYPL
jgi:hypothetical protein